MPLKFLALFKSKSHNVIEKMERTYIEDKKFDSINFVEKMLPEADYDNCQFVNCNFSNANLAKINFSDCEFHGCNLSMARLEKTALKDIQFKDCKLLGLHFEHCEEFLFAVAFENCILDLSSFYKRKLKKTTFSSCSLRESDFVEADLSASIFDNCDLEKAVFQHAILEKADFRTAYNYSIDPELNKISKAKFAIPAVIGLLDKFDIEIE